MSADRQIVLDTETTGLDPKKGERIVEIGCVEIVDLVPTGRTYQAYINPERAMSEGAAEITGLKDDFLKDFPVFAEVAEAFAAFIGDAPLVIHNAPFDVGFINAEFRRVGFKPLNPARIIDTLDMARRKFPGQRNSLDALCTRLNVDNSNRELHGALLDAEILAEVYAELNGGKQRGLGFGAEGGAEGGAEVGKASQGKHPGEGPHASARAAAALASDLRPTGIERPARAHNASEAELAAHETFLAARVKDALWNRQG